MSSPVIAVDHEDEALSVLEVMSPQGSDFVLTTHVPDGETDVLVFNSLDVEPFKRECKRQLSIIVKFPLYSPMVGMVVTISPNFSL